MTFEVLTEGAVERRLAWISEIVRISGNFGQDATRVEFELTEEVELEGPGTILDHLRLCGAIPEAYRHDSSEEKLYSKYTDALLAVAFRSIGLMSLVLAERAGVADIEVVGKDLGFVADAKAFRLSRSAKNQKDFKVAEMDRWKHGKSHAVVVCPLYQVPSRASAIYLQATTRDVCLLSYSHIAVLVAFGAKHGELEAQRLMRAILESVSEMQPSVDAVSYWTAINRVFLAGSPVIGELWKTEKIANGEAIEVSRTEALAFLASEREWIMRLSHAEALSLLVAANKLEGKARTIGRVKDNLLLSLN